MPAGAGPHYDFTIPAGIGGLGRYGFRFKLTSFAGAITITCRRIMTAGAGVAPAFCVIPYFHLRLRPCHPSSRFRR